MNIVDCIAPKISQGKRKAKRKEVRFLNTSSTNDSSTPEPATSSMIDLNDVGLNDMGIETFYSCAIENYCRFYGLPSGSAVLAQLKDLSARVLGWASYDGPGIPFEEPSPFPKTNPRNHKKCDHLLHGLNPVDPHAFYNTDEGQKELVSMDADRTSRTREALGLSTLMEHSSTGQISPMGNRNESNGLKLK